MVSIMPNNTWLLAQLGEGYAMVRMPHESIQAFEKLRKVGTRIRIRRIVNLVSLVSHRL